MKLLLITLLIGYSLTADCHADHVAKATFGACTSCAGTAVTDGCDACETGWIVAATATDGCIPCTNPGCYDCTGVAAADVATKCAADKCDMSMGYTYTATGTTCTNNMPAGCTKLAGWTTSGTTTTYSCAACDENSGYFLISGACKSCSTEVSNCLTCEVDGTSLKCKTPMPTHYLDSGELKACTAATENCLTCSDATTCTGCAAGYALNEGKCYKTDTCGASFKNIISVALVALVAFFKF